MRWGIETSFRNLKHTLGLLHLHAKKVEFVLQEIFAKLTMYNFCELITQSVVIRQAQKTHTYKVNFSDAVHICRQFFLGDVPPPILEAMLMRYISPIRLGRKDTLFPLNVRLPLVPAFEKHSQLSDFLNEYHRHAPKQCTN